MTETSVIYNGMLWFDLNELVSPKRTAGKVCLHQIRANNDSEYQINPTSILAKEAVAPCSKMTTEFMMSNWRIRNRVARPGRDSKHNYTRCLVGVEFAHAQLTICSNNNTRSGVHSVHSMLQL